MSFEQCDQWLRLASCHDSAEFCVRCAVLCELPCGVNSLWRLLSTMSKCALSIGFLSLNSQRLVHAFFGAVCTSSAFRLVHYSVRIRYVLPLLMEHGSTGTHLAILCFMCSVRTKAMSRFIEVVGAGVTRFSETSITESPLCGQHNACTRALYFGQM